MWTRIQRNKAKEFKFITININRRCCDGRYLVTFGNLGCSWHSALFAVAIAWLKRWRKVGRWMAFAQSWKCTRGIRGGCGRQKQMRKHLMCIHTARTSTANSNMNSVAEVATGRVIKIPRLQKQASLLLVMRGRCILSFRLLYFRTPLVPC